jgi:hypothetical protein
MTFRACRRLILRQYVFAAVLTVGVLVIPTLSPAVKTGAIVLNGGVLLLSYELMRREVQLADDAVRLKIYGKVSEFRLGDVEARWTPFNVGFSGTGYQLTLRRLSDGTKRSLPLVGFSQEHVDLLKAQLATAIEGGRWVAVDSG